MLGMEIVVYIVMWEEVIRDIRGVNRMSLKKIKAKNEYVYCRMQRNRSKLTSSILISCVL